MSTAVDKKSTLVDAAAPGAMDEPVRCPVCETPRTRNAAATRQAMLASARRRFLAESYENVGLRDIAGDAGVDATLVNRYFGSKEELFKEVLREGKSQKFDGGVPEHLPDHLAAMVADPDGHEDPYLIDRLLIILRSASSPQASEIVAKTVREDMLEPLARLLPGDDAELRATMMMSVMVGATLLRRILGVTTMCECDRDLVQEKLRALFAAAAS